MDLAMGAMGSLLPKLLEVIKDEYNLQKEVKKKVESFSAELKAMQAALGKVAEVPPDQLEDETKVWANEVRELSYEMEDVIDSLLVRVVGCDPNPNDEQNRLEKLWVSFKKLFKRGKAKHRISTDIEEIDKQLQKVAIRHERYKTPNLPAATRATLDPFLEVLYGDKKNIIGLEEARNDIIKKITEGDCKQLKTLSIVGFGGLGKTTLAKEVYDALATKFEHKAFVSVSRNPDMKKVLSDLLFKLDKKIHASHNAENLAVEKLIILIKEFLSNKRYFIILDDLWDKKAWKEISYALADNECGSIIITTTRHVEISKECCSSKDGMIHKMKSLSDDDSQKLFYGRIFLSEVCPSRFEQVSKEILKKCAGVPLAIISLASYLANNQNRDQIDKWEALLTSIGRGLKNDDDHVDEMKMILLLSYYDLPSYLKTCLLYLSIFPEDHQISRDRLIRRWICEGFIQVKGQTSPLAENQPSLLELGDAYFNELVNRNMIMPINIHGGRVEACCVHDIMLDLICELSSEENFVTILDFIKGDTPLEKKFRRLSLQKGMTDPTTTRMATTSMSQVRSFTAFTPSISKIPSLSRFQALRVFDLEGCDLGGSPGVDLRHVENLLHLRYLGLRGTKVGNLPMEIGKLPFLQTLDLQWTNSNELPSSVVQLRHLVCLILDLGMPLPNGFSNLTCLEQLTGHGVGIFSADSAIELGHLSRLRQLTFRWDSRQDALDFMKIDKALIQSLGKLHNLESLEISGAGSWVVGLMQDWVPSPNLRRLKFDGYRYFKSLPKWICSSSLPLLSYLDLHVQKVRTEDIQILGMLPALRYVTLMGELNKGRNSVEKLVLSTGAFPEARVCLFHNLILVDHIFQPGAMPMVQRLRFGLRVQDMDSPDFDLSIRNLPSLKQLRIDLLNDGSMPYSEAVDVLRRVADGHPKSPTLHADKFFQIG
ncbi:disease resistance protein RGA5-like [Triticum dicoccoides]|uniref:disease resistance protein RGA5-like n=1 Tax=Triticum dicoccoides TaxID=85692 RepID=UPI00188FA179|nr:disease resistance protein RGA5-like [Triticum dicoccoides]